MEDEMSKKLSEMSLEKVDAFRKGESRVFPDLSGAYLFLADLTGAQITRDQLRFLEGTLGTPTIIDEEDDPAEE